MYALGAMSKKDGRWREYLELGANLTETCYKMYSRQPRGIGGEKTRISDFHPVIGYYILRPEVVESIFYMWRLTHDPKYRQWGMDIALAIDEHCRVDGGYSGIQDVNSLQFDLNDNQESFFLAETLKYLYLLFTDDNVIPLEQYVFNTEAHPLKTVRYRNDVK